MTALSAFGCGGEYYKSESVVFSGSMVFSASLSGGKEKKAADEMKEFLSAMDGIFNSNIASSEISRFNKSAAGAVVEVSSHLYTVAKEAKRVYQLTNGAFNPALSAISKAWGVDKDGIAKYCYGGEKMPELPDYEELKQLEPDTKLELLSLSESNGKYFMTKASSDFTLDFGGIAKGYCVDELKRIAENNGVKSGIVSISGNLMLIGANAEKKPWSVGVVNPRPEINAGQYVCGFYEKDKSVVTSGDYERYHTFGNSENELKICHIIDGRTLLPIGVELADNENGYKKSAGFVISATVIGESSMLCDALATALCVMNIENGVELLKSTGYKGVMFTSDGYYAVVGEVEMAESVTLYRTAYSEL
jgi:thiamine biosynthesis lipoprotein